MAETSKRVSTSARTTSKRTSTAPSAPKPPSKIDPTAIIADKAVLTGTYPITIHAGAVLHPYCKVVSTYGPVEIGEGCIIWERAVVGLSESSNDDGGVLEKGVCLMRNVVVETSAVVEAEVIGEGSVIEGCVKVRRGAKIGKFCKIAAYIQLAEDDVVEDYTIVYGPNARRIDRTAKENSLMGDIKEVAHIKQLTGLKALIPSNLAKWT